MRGPPFRMFLMGSSSAHAAGSAFWFVWAWRLIGAVAWPGPRYVLQGLWVASVLVGLAAGLDLLGSGRTPPSPAPVGAVARIWLIASCIGFLAVTAVGGMERLAACDGGPAGGGPAGAGRTGAARRLPLRDLSGGGLPLLAAAYGATAGRPGIASSP